MTDSCLRRLNIYCASGQGRQKLWLTAARAWMGCRRSAYGSPASTSNFRSWGRSAAAYIQVEVTSLKNRTVGPQTIISSSGMDSVYSVAHDVMGTSPCYRYVGAGTATFAEIVEGITSLQGIGSNQNGSAE